MLAEIEKPSVRRHWLKAIRGLMQAAIPAMRKDDPTSGIPGIKLPRAEDTILGPMPRSSNTARIGRSALNSGLSSSSR